MPGDYRVNITSEALGDLRGIFDYIQRDSAENAAKTIERILDEIDSLKAMASRYKLVGRSRKRKTPVHSMVVRPYIVYYRVDEQTREVSIMSIRHGNRKQPRRFE
jgi:toxin ParE1/3/4